MLSIKDSNGKFKTKWVSLNISAEKGNKRKAEAELKRVIAEYETRGSVNYNDILFCDYLRQWLENHSSNIERVTYEGYSNIVEKHLYPYFKNLGKKLFDLKPINIQDYYNYKHSLEKNGLSANTIRRHHAIIRKSLQHALQMDMIQYNPADRVTLPKIERYREQAYTLEQASIRA